MRRPRTLLVCLALIAITSVAAGYWYHQFTKEVDVMTSIRIPTFESGFSK